MSNWSEVEEGTFIRTNTVPSDEENVYPKQDKGDFIVFPSRALHKIDSNTSDEERVVTAGNLSPNQISTEFVDNTVNVVTLTNVSKFVRVWEQYEQEL